MPSARQLRNLRQEVTRWPTSTTRFDGFTFSPPELQNGRWEEIGELFRSPSGEELVSRAVVYLTDDVNIGDFVALGDYTEVSNPTTLVGLAFRVRQFSKVPNIRNVEMERKAFL